jgi:rubrerythrin
MLDTLKNLTSLEILGVAVRKEIEAATFYERFAERIKNELVKQKISNLGIEEKNHEKLLMNLYRKQTGEEHPPIPPRDKQDEEDFERFDQLSNEQLIELAIERERSAEEMYMIASQKTSDGGSRFMLLHLSEMEKGHRIALDLELESLRKDQNWFEKDLGTDIQLFGP